MAATSTPGDKKTIIGVAGSESYEQTDLFSSKVLRS